MAWYIRHLIHRRYLQAGTHSRLTPPHWVCDRAHATRYDSEEDGRAALWALAKIYSDAENWCLIDIPPLGPSRYTFLDRREPSLADGASAAAPGWYWVDNQEPATEHGPFAEVVQCAQDFGDYLMREVVRQVLPLVAEKKS